MHLDSYLTKKVRQRWENCSLHPFHGLFHTNQKSIPPGKACLHTSISRHAPQGFKSQRRLKTYSQTPCFIFSYTTRDWRRWNFPILLRSEWPERKSLWQPRLSGSVWTSLERLSHSQLPHCPIKLQLLPTFWVFLHIYFSGYFFWILPQAQEKEEKIRQHYNFKLANFTFSPASSPTSVPQSGPFCSSVSSSNKNLDAGLCSRHFLFLSSSDPVSCWILLHSGGRDELLDPRATILEGGIGTPAR